MSSDGGSFFFQFDRGGGEGGPNHHTGANMPPKSAKRSRPSNASAGVKKPRTTKRSANPGRGRVTRARPMRSLAADYRSINEYRFMRETVPITVPFNVIPAGNSFKSIGYLKFDNLQFNQLVQSTQDFGNLFARYKVDRIETYLTPMFDRIPAITGGTVDPLPSPALTITRLNTKYLDEEFAISADADDQLAVLAQFQSKTVSQYAKPGSMKLITDNPGVEMQGVIDSTGATHNYRAAAPWLNISLEADVPFKHNSLIFAERTDGAGIDEDFNQPTTQSFKYRVVHRVYFRCSQVS